MEKDFVVVVLEMVEGQEIVVVGQEAVAVGGSQQEDFVEELATVEVGGRQQEDLAVVMVGGLGLGLG